MLRLPPRSTRTDTFFPYTTLFRSSGQNLAVDLVTGVAGGDAHDDARDRIVRLRLAAADRILAVGDLRARIAQLGREFVAPLRIETSRIIVRLGAAGEEGVEPGDARRSEEHTSELQSLMRISYAVFRLKKKKRT